MDGELAEAVADLLARYAPSGVALQRDTPEQHSSEDLVTDLLTVRAYLPTSENLQDSKQQIEEGLWHLSQIQPLPQPSYRWINQEQWTDLWKAEYKPIPIGRRLLIIPAWYPIPEGDRLPVILDPGIAFGTGAHPTTRLCLAALEDHLAPGEAVVDVGCGSGILSIAAARLGAGSVLAVDIDPQAVENARQNVLQNKAAELVQVEIGSIPQLLPGTTPERQPGDLLLANIYAPILEQLLHSGLERAVRPGGKLILSGILEQQTESLLATCRSLNLQPLETLQEGDWVALVLRTPQSQADPGN